MRREVFVAPTEVYFNIFSAGPSKTTEHFSRVSRSPSRNLNPVLGECGVDSIITRLPYQVRSFTS